MPVNYFFFFKQKTAYEIMSGDWSSDVCSSGLAAVSLYATHQISRVYAPIPKPAAPRCGVTRDKEEGARWLRVSAQAGHQVAQVDLANLVLEGAGEAEDSSRIAGWFKQAASAGDLVAAFNLGVCLEPISKLRAGVDPL